MQEQGPGDVTAAGSKGCRLLHSTERQTHVVVGVARCLVGRESQQSFNGVFFISVEKQTFLARVSWYTCPQAVSDETSNGNALKYFFENVFSKRKIFFQRIFFHNFRTKEIPYACRISIGGTARRKLNLCRFVKEPLPDRGRPALVHFMCTERERQPRAD